MTTLVLTLPRNKITVQADLITTEYVLKALLEQMNKRGLKDIENLRMSQSKMPVFFEEKGIEDFWGQSHGGLLTTKLGKAEEIHLNQQAPKAKCMKCRAKTCENCECPEVQATLEMMKSMKQRQR